jgi:hypothetical protein
VSVPLEILTALRKHFPSSGHVLGQGARINEERWREVAAQTADPEVTWVLNNLSRPITRSDIIGLHHPNPAIRRRRVVITSLMWGYGVTGTRWGSWVTEISDFLSPSLDAVLADCEAHLSAGRIAEAYRLFARPGPGGKEAENHRGIGFPFITKMLYLLARGTPRTTSLPSTP